MFSEHKYKLVIAILLFGLVNMLGCFYDNNLITESEVSGEISFNGDIIPIFNKDCNTSGCHNTGGTKPDLSPGSAYLSLNNGNYLNTDVPEQSELYLWMKGFKAVPMPVSGSNASHNAKILAWIKQGSLNN